MGGKDCPKFEKAKANPLPDSEDAAPSKRNRRMRYSLDQAIGSLPGKMGHVHLGDPLQEEFIVIGHRGSHHRRRGHCRSGPDDEHNQSDTSQEEDGIDIQRRTRMGKSGGRCRRGPKHGHHQLDSAGACKGRMGTLDEVLSGRPENRRRLAHHMRRIHHHHRKHKEAAATIEILRTALRDEIGRPCKRRHGHRGSTYQGHHAHNHHHRDDFKSDDDASEDNQEGGDTSSSEQPRHNSRSSGRCRNAIRLAHIYHHRRLGHLHAHAFKLRGKGNYGKRSAMPLATSDFLPGWTTYDTEAFGRRNRHHNHRELLNDVQRDAILMGGRVAVIHGRRRRFMHGHHHKFMGLH